MYKNQKIQELHKAIVEIQLHNLEQGTAKVEESVEDGWIFWVLDGRFDFVFLEIPRVEFW